MEEIRRADDAPGASPVLVDGDWALAHLHDPAVRFVEVDERASRGQYNHGHIPGAVNWRWEVDLQDPVRRDVPGPEALSALLARSGIGPLTHVVLYGDPDNWFAAYAYWLLRLYGWPRLSLLDGGRRFWIGSGLPVTRETPVVDPAVAHLPTPSDAFRAFHGEVLALAGHAANGAVLVDARSPAEYAGEVIAPPGMAETAQRPGHIPGAVSIPWDAAVRPDGTFRSPAELTALYEGEGITPDQDVITYCRIGERSSHSWFVLHELLGYPRVRNYDGSWTEWGSTVRAPIELGQAGGRLST
jgi:thiosulfate/3-mercaptopyruvate sulfurtransferase